MGVVSSKLGALKPRGGTGSSFHSVTNGRQGVEGRTTGANNWKTTRPFYMAKVELVFHLENTDLTMDPRVCGLGRSEG